MLVFGTAAVIATGAWGAASAMVFDTLTNLPGGCPARFGDDSPTRFSVSGNAFDTTPYWMPPPEDVRFASRDRGITVSGWWLPARDARAPAVVMVHGVRACKRDYTVLLPAGMLHRNGFSVLLIDLRDHGDTTREDGRQTGGADEADEVLGAWDWLRESQRIPEDRIGVAGLSFGAAVALMAAGREQSMGAVWADSSFADVDTIVRDHLAAERLPPFLDGGAQLMARLIFGRELDPGGAVAAVEAMDGQALYLSHGGADAVIPARHTEVLGRVAAERGLDVTVWISPGVAHTAAEYMEAAAYEDRLVSFFRSRLVAEAAVGDDRRARDPRARH